MPNLPAPHWKIVSLLVLWLVISPFALAADEQRPNFIIIILDDVGGRDIGAYGNNVVQTPNIDELARHGVQFNNVFLTASTCTSSRTSILTGIHPFKAGAPRLGTAPPADQKLLSHYLHEAGYFTASVGKWHLGDNVRNQFDLIVDEREPADESESGSEDWVSTIESRLPVHKPFFLWLASRDAHRPWLPVKEWSIHDPEKISIPAYIEINKTHPPEFVKKELAMYYDEIHRADFYTGEVIQTLQKKHLLENSVVIVMSDNGSPFWKAKKFLTDPGLRTPFIVYWPKQIKQAKQIDQLMSSVDITPTLLELAGVNVPDNMEGKSFASWLRSSDTDHAIHDVVYGERGDPVLGSENGRSIRDKKYLYIIDDYPTYTDCSDKSKLDFMRGEQLYDVVNDPDNLHNLVTHHSWSENIWDRLTGKTDYSATIAHYRNLMNSRRQQRNDLPQPVINGACPPMWWHEEPAEDSTSTSPMLRNNPATTHD